MDDEVVFYVLDLFLILIVQEDPSCVIQRVREGRLVEQLTLFLRLVFIWLVLFNRFDLLILTCLLCFLW